MTEDKIALTLQDISKAREALKGIKKDVKIEEKITTDEYLELKKALKDLKEQVKRYEEDQKSELSENTHYQKLREMALEQEEELAHLNMQLFTHLAKMPQKSFKMNVDTDSGTLLVQCEPEMKIYLNGKEEKRRA
ncbi:MAG: hypothetical protein Q8P68_00025 [Candidatus Peregrinibacteria bacterium]|nr:hypothetical protein [Candidatus Peregrinibacteria bacterium]MDZ4244900.1 hypothetical protein [Candidatus Gracilibacteria bacterium]